MLKKRIRWSIVLIALPAVTATVMLMRSSRQAEPVYQGKTFSEWLERVPVLPGADDPAVVAIRNMGRPAAPLLAKALNQKRSLQERLYAVVPFWLLNCVPSRGRTQKPTWQIQDSAAAVLIRLGPQAEDAIPGVIKCLDNPDKRIREKAAETLGAIGVGKQEVVAPLLKMLGDSESAYYAMLALAELSLSDTSIVPALIEAAQANNAKVKYWALVALEEIGSEAKAALPVLIRALKSGDWETRVAAAKTVGLIGPEAMDALRELTNNLFHKQEWVRKCAAIALGRIGPSATSAIPALTIALTNDDYNAMDIARSLWVIDHSQSALVMPVIAKELTAPREADRIRYAFLNAMDLAGEIGAPSSNLVESLELAVTDEAGFVRFNAAYALWRIVPESEPKMRPILEELVREKQESCPARLAALGALWQLLPEQRPRLKAALSEFLKDWEELTSMKEVTPGESTLIPALEAVLQDESCRPAHSAARAALRRITGTHGERW